jgi:hypothetical protein
VKDSLARAAALWSYSQRIRHCGACAKQRGEKPFSSRARGKRPCGPSFRRAASLLRAASLSSASGPCSARAGTPVLVPLDGVGRYLDAPAALRGRKHWEFPAGNRHGFAVLSAESVSPVAPLLAYDSAGNRTTEQTDDSLMGATYNNMNRLVSQQAFGALRLEGTVSEPATIIVAGKALEMERSAITFATCQGPIRFGFIRFRIARALIV